MVLLEVSFAKEAGPRSCLSPGKRYDRVMHLETVNCIFTGSVVALHYICYCRYSKVCLICKTTQFQSTEVMEYKYIEGIMLRLCFGRNLAHE